MPDRRRHRGPHPADHSSFGPEQHAALRLATEELSWLLARDYKMTSALALVGNRHALKQRQRLAVQRSACTDREREDRRARQVSPASLRDREAMLDGFNCIIALEAALSGGVLLRGRDGVLRDLASVHGSYRRVEETEAAVDAIVELLSAHGCARARWLLDRPVSNSGRLAALIREVAEDRLEVEVELLDDPDRQLIQRGTEHVVCSGDCVVIDGVRDWLDVPAAVIEASALDPWLVDLG